MTLLTTAPRKEYERGLSDRQKEGKEIEKGGNDKVIEGKFLMQVHYMHV